IIHASMHEESAGKTARIGRSRRRSQDLQKMRKLYPCTKPENRPEQSWRWIDGLATIVSPRRRTRPSRPPWSDPTAAHDLLTLLHHLLKRPWTPRFPSGRCPPDRSPSEPNLTIVGPSRGASPARIQ